MKTNPKLGKSEFASTALVAAALERLSDVDMARLKELAQLRTYGLPGTEWSDLFNEAVARSLGGERRWPLGVPFVAFMAQTMRSVASDERRKISRENLTLEADLPISGENEIGAAIDELAASSVDLERERAARQALEQILDLFTDDEDALRVLDGMGRGQLPEEIQSLAGMNETRYHTTQRRIRRTLEKAKSLKEYTQ